MWLPCQASWPPEAGRLKCSIEHGAWPLICIPTFTDMAALIEWLVTDRQPMTHEDTKTMNETPESSPFPEALRIASSQEIVASEQLAIRLQAMQVSGVLSDVAHEAMQGWTDRLARTTARLKDVANAWPV
jgi:hypothetical protein